MLAVSGYYDGAIIQPLEKFNAKPNQRVIITIMDEFVAPDAIERKREALQGFFALAGNIDLDEQSVNELREGSKL